MMKVVVACDSFKGSLTSQEVAEAASSGIRSTIPDAEVVCLPVGDGGEGTAESLISAMGARLEHCNARDPLGRWIGVSYGIVDRSGTTMAILDVASACGLTLLAPEERDIMKASYSGVGDILRAAYSKGCRRFLVGLGGSATCDGGRGMLRSLDGDDEVPALQDIYRCPVILFSDVDNPLLGPQGAARVFAPQKGATPAEVEILEKDLQNFADNVKTSTGKDFRNHPGAGAAGGLGFAFLSFFNSELRSGAEGVLDALEFDNVLSGADLVITGEGRMDNQTLHGKLPMVVLRRAAGKAVPCVAIAGQVRDRETLNAAGFSGIYELHQHTLSLEEAMRAPNARRAVARTVASIIKERSLPNT